MSKIKIFALGGLNEEGKNMYVVKVDNDIFVFDAGLKFASDKLLGVDYVIPNFDYIKENKDKLTFTDKEIEFMCHVISSHMGPWNTNNYSDIILPKPESKFQRFVHMCDYLASRKVIDVKFDGNNNIIE